MYRNYSFNAHYGLIGKTADEFIDVPLNSDLEAFICPFLIANNRDDALVGRIYDQLVHFFTKLNKDYVLPNNRSGGLKFLSRLHEPNEYHLGYSSDNKGKAIANEKAETIYDSLRKNQFAKQGISITNEAHNILLLVEGIGQDIMSDTIANVCRNIFAEFTERICAKYGIKTSKTKIWYYDTTTGSWQEKSYNLPVYKGKAILLIPALIASGSRSYSTRYNWFIASHRISKDLMSNKIRPAKKVLKTLKDGTKKAVIKEIYRVYKKPKSKLIDFVMNYKGSLQEFLDYCKVHYPALNLGDISE